MMISIAGNYTLNIDQTHTYTDKKTDRPKYKKQQQQRKNKPTQCFIEYNNDTWFLACFSFVVCRLFLFGSHHSSIYMKNWFELVIEKFTGKKNVAAKFAEIIIHFFSFSLSHFPYFISWFIILFSVTNNFFSSIFSSSHKPWIIIQSFSIFFLSYNTSIIAIIINKKILKTKFIINKIKWLWFVIHQKVKVENWDLLFLSFFRDRKSVV